MPPAASNPSTQIHRAENIMICRGTCSLSQTLDASFQATLGAPAPSSTEHCKFFSLRVGLTKQWSANSGSWTAQRWCISHFWIMFVRLIQHDLKIFCGIWLWVYTNTAWSEQSSVLCVPSSYSDTTVATLFDTKDYRPETLTFWLFTEKICHLHHEVTWVFLPLTQ